MRQKLKKQEEDQSFQQRLKLIKNINPHGQASFWSKAIVNWAKPYITISQKKPWEQNLHPNLLEEDLVKSVYPQFEQAFFYKKSIWKATLKVHRCEIIEVLIATIIMICLNFSNAFFLSNIVEIIETNKQQLTEDHTNTITLNFVLIMLSALLSPVIRRHYQFRVYHISYKVRTAVMAMITKKALNFSVMNSEVHTEGTVINYLQVDIIWLEYYLEQIRALLEVALSIFIGMVAIWYFIGLGVLGLFLVTLIINLVYAFVYYMRSRVTDSLMNAKDKRLSYLKSVLKGIDYVKLSCLENYYCFKIFEKRYQEIRCLLKLAFLSSLGFFIEFMTPGLTQISIFAYFMYWKPDEFNFAKFTGFMQVYEVLKTSVMSFNVWLGRMIEMLISVNRISKFLLEDDIDRSAYQRRSGDFAIKVEDGCFRWGALNSEKGYELFDKPGSDPGGPPVRAPTAATTASSQNLLQYFELQNLNFEVKKGEKAFIIGKSSAGKSSLLYAIMGEMNTTNEVEKVTVKYNGDMMFLSQDPWTIGDTAKENILLGAEYDENLMDEAIEFAQMKMDIKSMSNGLDTVLGDTGHTVSGGQRARIGLARCFYQKYEILNFLFLLIFVNFSADIYLLDDPLSALDTKIASKLLDSIMQHPKFSKKTFLFSTNNESYLKYADRILYIDDGKLVFNGTFEEFKGHKTYKSYHIPKKGENDPKVKQFKTGKIEKFSSTQDNLSLNLASFYFSFYLFC